MNRPIMDAHPPSQHPSSRCSDHPPARPLVELVHRLRELRDFVQPACFICRDATESFPHGGNPETSRRFPRGLSQNRPPLAPSGNLVEGRPVWDTPRIINDGRARGALSPLHPSGSQGAISEVCNLTARISSLFPSFRESIPSRIALRLEIPTSPLWTRMGGEILDELIRELVSTSVSAIPRQGTIWMTAWLGAFADLQPAACLRIEGTGTSSLKASLRLPHKPDPHGFCDAVNLPGLADALTPVLQAGADAHVECAAEVGTSISLRFPLAPQFSEV